MSYELRFGRTPPDIIRRRDITLKAVIQQTREAEEIAREADEFLRSTKPAETNK